MGSTVGKDHLRVFISQERDRPIHGGWANRVLGRDINTINKEEVVTYRLLEEPGHFWRQLILLRISIGLGSSTSEAMTPGMETVFLVQYAIPRRRGQGKSAQSLGKNDTSPPT